MRRLLCCLLTAAMLTALCACAPAETRAEDDPPPVTEVPPETGKPGDTPPAIDYESVDWPVFSLNPEDYGILYDEEHMNVKDFPLAKLCVYCLYSDGAYAEGAQDEVYRRFMEAPYTVLHFLSFLGDQTARGGQTGEETAAAELCRAIAFADVFWYEDTGALTAIIQQYRAVYTEGRIAELLDKLEAEHDNAASMGG